MSPIRNNRQLVSNGMTPPTRRARALALSALAHSLSLSDPYALLIERLQLRANTLAIDDLRVKLNRFSRVLVFGAGKASVPMLEALRRILVERLSGGLVCVPRGHAEQTRTWGIEIFESSHPRPDRAGFTAAKRIEQVAQELTRRDLAICIFSGGASAMLPAPKPGLSIRDKAVIANLLMRAGATIDELNCVRKHLSTLKGGQLAKLLSPATVITLLLSDVVGDRLDTIASGPTAPDPTTYRDAIQVLRKYKLWGKAPSSVKRILTWGASGKFRETPKPGDLEFRRVRNFIIGNNETACNAAVSYLRSRKVDAGLLTSTLEGEARHVGTVLGSIAGSVAREGRRARKARAFVAGGETIVEVRGRGKGGRNQEVALAAAMKVQAIDGVAVASLATDGIDGPTDAAGAVVDGYTVQRAKTKRLDPEGYLRANDSYSFFAKLKDLIFTGATGTNVGDIAVIIVLPKK